MPTSFGAMENETRPLALLDADPGAHPDATAGPRRHAVWWQVAKASLIVGGGLALLAVA